MFTWESFGNSVDRVIVLIGNGGNLASWKGRLGSALMTARDN